jgi:Protein of unknown function (DUF3616)
MIAVRMFRLLWLTTLATTSCLLAASLACAEPVAPVGKLTVKPGLSVDDDEATNVSGAARSVSAGTRKSCLLIGDEVKYARFFSIEGPKLVPGDKLFLLPERDENDNKFKETDAEGIAFADEFYYVVGSHGLNKKGAKQPSRYFVYRIEINPQSGRPADLGTADRASMSVLRKNVLEELIAKDPILKDHVDDIPGKQGVNIEGIAAIGADLYFGFRGPLVEDAALVMQVPARAIFEGQRGGVQMHSLPLGKGQGIRDLAGVRNGLLLLSGPEERKAGKAEVFFWKQGSAPLLLADLGGPRADGGQPEVLLLLEETQNDYSILVMSDGPAGGDPTIFEIAKP